LSTVAAKREPVIEEVPRSTSDSTCAQREASLPAEKTRAWVPAA
jgi:hypothetical protein